MAFKTYQRSSQRRDRTTGFVVIVVAILLVIAAGYHAHRGPSHHSVLGMAVSYWSRSAQAVTLQDSTRRVVSHDPVYYMDSSGGCQFAGYVHDQTPADSGNHEVVVNWCLPTVAPESMTWTLHENRGSFADAIQLLLPAEKRTRIEQRIRTAFEQHGAELANQLLPILEDSLKRSLPIIETAVRQSAQDHRAEIDQLGQKWNESVVRQRLVPLTTQRMLPIVRKHGEPVAREVGEELWQRASVWRFGWRIVYDKSPLPQKDLTNQEWTRFVNDEAIPVFEAHSDEIATAIRQSLVEIANDPEVRKQLAEAADVMASDPDSQRLLRTVLRESLVENAELHRVWREAWTSPEAARALAAAGDRVEPLVRQIGEELLGTPDGGIEPGFARLLRNQILRKDQRWLVAQTSQQADSQVRLAREPMPFPLPAFTGQSPLDLTSSSSVDAR